MSEVNAVKLLTDDTGNAILNELKQQTLALGGTPSNNGGYIGLPPSDGKAYVIMNGKWVEANISTNIDNNIQNSSPDTTDINTTSTQTVVNEDGRANITFYFPWKFATNITNDLIKDKLHTE